MFKDFVDKLREVAKQQKTENGTWGWNEDKKMYSDNVNADRKDYRDFTVINRSDNTEKKLRIGYDSDNNKIASAGFVADDGSVKSYVGQDNLADFFKNNFDMDMSDYMVLDDTYNDDKNSIAVTFDSSTGGRFIPSTVFKKNAESISVPLYNQDKPDQSVPKSFYDAYRNAMTRFGTTANPYVAKDDYEKLNNALRSHLRTFEMGMDALPKGDEEWRYIGDNRDEFRKTLDRFSSEPDKAKRVRILDEAAKRFNGSQRLLKYLGEIRDLEENSENLEYPEYPIYGYKEVSSQVMAALDDIMNWRYHRA